MLFNRFYRILFLLLHICGTSSYAQTIEQIINDEHYYHGVGTSKDYEEARTLALTALVDNISLNISNVTSLDMSNTITNGGVQSVEDFKSSMKSYSTVTLNNLKSKTEAKNSVMTVLLYIEKSEVEKMFEARKHKILDMVESAERAISKGKVDDALRNYYWALSLLKSLQSPSSVTYTSEAGKSFILSNWIIERMDEILDDIKLQATKRTGDDVELFITYKDKPINSIDYTYFDGRSWSNIYSAKDGRGVLELAAGNNSNQYHIRVEYEYRGEARIDEEILTVLNNVSKAPVKNAEFNVQGVASNAKVKPSPSASTATFSTTPAEIVRQPQGLLGGIKEYDSLMGKIIAAIAKKDQQSVSQYFTPEGLEMYNKLIHYGNARILDASKVHFYEDRGYVTSRGLIMSFSFANGVRKSFVEDVVFTFSPDKKVCNIAFGLGKTAEDDILNKGVWSETARKAIMSFLENYKTAYALKSIDYIRDIFDDDAVIITATVSKNPKIVSYDSNNSSFGDNKIIKYNRQTKDQYLQNLKRCFENNEFVNIRFANNDVYKLGKGGELYAIQISQDYYSSKYGDKGYLFLMVDINDASKPLIKVRTWQPDKDPNFGLYGPGDF